MKTKYLLITMAVAMVLMACNREEKNLFDKSASERSAEYMQNAKDVLINNTNGWNMIYFANPTSTDNGQIHIIFCANGEVKAQMAKSTKKLDSDTVSVWEVIDDICPLLTFNTYNNILHYWSDPQEDGVGFGGDYEFLIMEATPEIVRLKGKKYGAYSVLYPVGANYDPCENYKKCEDMSNILIGNGNFLTYSEGSTQYMLHDATGAFFLTELYQAPDENPVIEPYSVLADGLQIMSTISGENNTNRRFMFGEDGLLHSQTATIGPLLPYSQHFIGYLNINYGYWIWSVADINPTAQELVKAISDVFKEYDNKGKAKNPKAEMLDMVMHSGEMAGIKDKILLDFRYTTDGKKKMYMQFLYDVSVNGDQIIIKYDSPLDPDAAQTMFKSNPKVLDMLNLLSGTYTIETTAQKINPTLGIKITNTENSLWYNLTGSANAVK